MPRRSAVKVGDEISLRKHEPLQSQHLNRGIIALPAESLNYPAAQIESIKLPGDPIARLDAVRLNGIKIPEHERSDPAALLVGSFGFSVGPRVTRARHDITARAVRISKGT